MPGNIDQLLRVYDDIQDGDDNGVAAVSHDVNTEQNSPLQRSKSNQSLSIAMHHHHTHIHHPMEHKTSMLRSVSQTDLNAAHPPTIRTSTSPSNGVINGVKSTPGSGAESNGLPTPTLSGRKHAGSNVSSGSYSRGGVPAKFGLYKKQHSQTSINLRKPVVSNEQHPPHRPASPNLRQRGGMSPSTSMSRLSQFETMDGELEDLDLGDAVKVEEVPTTITIAPRDTPAREQANIATVVTPPISPRRKKSGTQSPLHKPTQRNSVSSNRSRNSIQSAHNFAPVAEITKESSQRTFRLLSPCDAVKPSFGFAIQRHGQHIYIICAQKGTPAAEAKLRVGDELLSVNKRDISQFTIGQVMSLVRKDYACTLSVASQPTVRFFKIEKKGHPMEMTINKCQITHLVSGGLADRAGIPQGYYIICVNGKSAMGLSDQKVCMAMGEHDTLELELIAGEAYRDFFNNVVVEKLAKLNYY